MSWTLLIGLVLALLLALVAALLRRAELSRMQRSIRQRDRAVRQGAAQAQLRHPVVDLSRCLGCATCVAVCPEDGVLELVHGQAMVVNGTRCQGISACERECPVGAITVTLANVAERADIPALNESLEAIDVPGLFLAGEVTAHALIKTAIDHGVAVAAEVARRTRENRTLASVPAADECLDLCIVGAGPAGLACALEAKRAGLSFVAIDQEAGLGGAVARYPRRKLVMTQPVDMPLYGRLRATSYSKEELMEFWWRIATEQELPIVCGEVFEGLAHDEHGHFLLRTQTTTYRARHVCLAVGRRGTPRKLGIPGEELPKVAYSLLDAHSYQGRRVLVVGGGDSAVETTLALAEQPGNEVVLSYRKEAFFRVSLRNEERLKRSAEEGRVQVLMQSRVIAIHPEAVELEVGTQGPYAAERIVLPNDEVFILAGGVPPFALLERSGVSFDPSVRQPSVPLAEQGTGALRALAIGFSLALGALCFALFHRGYYALPLESRPAHPKHDWLGPSHGLGLFFGISAAVLIVLNLLYLLRRSPRVRFNFGSLRLWMTSHVATGILAVLCALLHGAMAPRDTVGGDAFWALVVLLLTGAVGRYFYAWVPRAANGRELELEEARGRLYEMSEEWDQGQRSFRQRVREQVLSLVEQQQWRSSFIGRIASLISGEQRLRRTLQALAREGAGEGIPADEVAEILSLARRAHRSALSAAHLEDLRAVLSSWRYLHRWVAALMVALVLVHVGYALFYSDSFFGGGSR